MTESSTAAAAPLAEPGDARPDTAGSRPWPEATRFIVVLLALFLVKQALSVAS